VAIKHRIIVKNGYEVKSLTRGIAIRQKCLECCCWQNHEVRLCPSKDCALWPYRMGKEPKINSDGKIIDPGGVFSD